MPAWTESLTMAEPATPGAGPDAEALLRSRSYLLVLVMAALVGIPVSAIAYYFLQLVSVLQKWLFETLPVDVGFHAPPAWWPLPLLALAGVVVAAVLRYLPGTGGHAPADGFKAGGGPPSAIDLPAVILAALGTLALGVVLGPEAPLIAIGGGLGAIAVRLVKRDAPQQAALVIAAAGSFAAISTLMGSPLLGAFLLLEASGVAGAMVGVVLVPGLLAAGVGSLIFVGLNSLTGLGTFSLSIPDLPPFAHPTVGMVGWALVFGLVAAVLGWVIRSLALILRPHVEPRMLLIMPVLGLGIAGLAMLFAHVTGKPNSEVLFSGQTALPALVGGAAAWTSGALVLLILCKGIAYGLSLSSFRGGPVFPSMFIGAAAGMAVSHLPGLSLVPAVAMGIGAMCTSMLRLPLTATLLATLLLGTDGLAVMPVVIVAVVVAYVVTARLPLPGEVRAAAGPGSGPSAAGAG
jgi:H+/Cl- antiporter ClcA